jgi:SAM-dependent methyltransferase
MKKQVDVSHYKFADYMSKRRWTSVWHQLDETMRTECHRVLEIGPGLGLLKAVAGLYGLHVETFDIDPDLNPDHLGSVLEMPFDDGAYDVVCAFQMLEHLEYSDSLTAVSEFGRIAGRFLIVSLPEARKFYPIHLTIPRIGLVTLRLPFPHLRPIPNDFDGQHHWEVGRSGYPLKRILKEFADACGMTLSRQYLVPENPRHRFLIFERS